MSEAANAGMLEFWNGDAGQKWVRFQERMDVSLAPFGHKAMDVAGLADGAKVIDVGCGCGDTSFELARRVGETGSVLGVDISEPMLARARERAQATGVDTVAFRQADAQVQTFDESAYDAVFSRFGVMFFEDPVTAFRNLKSALKPGGRIGFACWQPAKDNPWVRIPVGVAKQYVEMPAPPGPDDPGEFAFGDPDRVRRILSEAGFADIVIDKLDMPIAVAGGTGLDAAVEFLTQMGPTARALAEANVGDDAKARMMADLREALVPYDTDDGVVMQSGTWIVSARA
ncbi:MAG: class I SAM-dependent methyltransferase [Minwuiales bacterium]|nr:class I SAM-dependent methyltransferase [Minwuiales bacterium]